MDWHTIGQLVLIACVVACALNTQGSSSELSAIRKLLEEIRDELRMIETNTSDRNRPFVDTDDPEG